MVTMCPAHYAYSSLTPMARYVFDLKQLGTPHTVSWDILDEQRLYKIMGMQIRRKKHAEVRLDDMFQSSSLPDSNGGLEIVKLPVRTTLSNYRPKVVGTKFKIRKI